MKGLGYMQREESGGTKGENPRGRLQGQDEMIAIPTQLTGGRGDGPEIQEHVEALGVSYFLLHTSASDTPSPRGRWLSKKTGLQELFDDIRKTLAVP